MTENVPGFDKKYVMLSYIAITSLAIAQFVIYIKILLGDSPSYVDKPWLAEMLCLGSGVFSLIILWALIRDKIRGSIASSLVSALFATVGLYIGLPPKAMWIMLVSSALVFVIVFFGGEKADLLTPTKTIKIKLPW